MDDASFSWSGQSSPKRIFITLQRDFFDPPWAHGDSGSPVRVVCRRTSRHNPFARTRDCTQ